MDLFAAVVLNIILVTVMHTALAANEGVCIESKTEKRTKVILQRKSFIDFTYTVCPTGFCGKSRINFKEEFVPKEYLEEVNTPYCCPGYTKTSNFTNVTSIGTTLYGTIGCNPECNPPCVDGLCVAPNMCQCPKDMKLQYDLRTCKFECDPNCENGDCVGHNVCACHERYIAPKDEPHVCLPQCKMTCVNAYCISPDNCRCEDGYKKNPFKSNECLPVCVPSCINGVCVGLNKCKCDEGYEKSPLQDSVCEPVCKSCVNGECVSPNVCECNLGYQKGIRKVLDVNVSSYEDGECEPICKPGCINGVCVTPNFCDCLDGYKKNALNNTLCEPTCEPSCANGICTAPNECTCEGGYVQSTEQRELCIPTCRNCENDTGICIAPDVCLCRTGYTRNEEDTVCEPLCVPPCFNANCTRPNQCECHDGFYKPENDQGVTHVCDSKVKRCKKNIDRNIKKVANETDNALMCFEFDNVLEAYDQLCQMEFTNNTCYDDHCVVDNGTICNMVYTCNIWPDLLNPSSVAATCSWNFRDDLTVENSEQNDTVYRVDSVYSQKGEGDFESTVGKNSEKTDLQSLDNTQLLQSLYFFRPNFDTNPCLLCLCPVEEKRNVCFHEKIHLRLCQCPKEDSGKVVLGVSRKAHVLIVSTVFSLLIISIGALLYAARRRYEIYKKKTAFNVKAYSNNIYCEGTNQEVENIYCEISSEDLATN